MVKILVAFALLTFMANFSFAHGVKIFAYVEEGKVITESYFADGSPVKNGRVEIYTKEDKKILEGTTDDKGVFSFKIPSGVSELKVIVDAGMGHRASYKLKEEDLK